MKATGLTAIPKMTPSWQLVKPSWQLLPKHFDQIIFLFLLPALTYILGGLLLGNIHSWHELRTLTRHQETGVLILGLGALWSLINAAPAMYFRVQIAGGKPTTLGSCYRQGLAYFWRLMGLYLLLGFSVLVGFLLFILPGFVVLYIVLSRYYLSGYYLVDQNLSIREALHKSHEETKLVVVYIWGVIGVQLAFGVIAGIIAQIFLQLGGVVSILINLVCLFLPALRYYEVRGVPAHAKRR